MIPSELTPKVAEGTPHLRSDVSVKLIALDGDPSNGQRSSFSHPLLHEADLRITNVYVLRKSVCSAAQKWTCADTVEDSTEPWASLVASGRHRHHQRDRCRLRTKNHLHHLIGRRRLLTGKRLLAGGSSSLKSTLGSPYPLSIAGLWLSRPGLEPSRDSSESRRQPLVIPFLFSPHRASPWLGCFLTRDDL